MLMQSLSEKRRPCKPDAQPLTHFVRENHQTAIAGGEITIIHGPFIPPTLVTGS
jgi:hypothetical protein